MVAHNNILIYFSLTSCNTSDTYPAYVFVIVDGGNKHLERTVLFNLWRVDIIYNSIEKRNKVGTFLILAERRCTCPARTEKYRTFQLIVISVKVQKEFQNFVADFVKTCVRTVDFIYNYNYLMIHFQSL